MPQEFPITPDALARLRRYPPFVHALGQALARERFSRDLQLQQLASKIGSTHGSLSRIEHGKYAAVGELARRAAEALGLDYDSLEHAVWSALSDDEKDGFAEFHPPPRGPRREQQVARQGLELAPVIATARDLARALGTREDITLEQYVDLLEVVLESANPGALVEAMAAVMK